ncbi:FAD-binding domain-containing protein [Pseudonocardia endophytica]|uniref:FAD-binding domain-containing protein n=1 Tax=Pseudonocardia endophytica TaxID=401976 RepID=UPI001A9ED3FE|nr:FAD-binding domain-containing protein [Pseudonocardia endophytica]
MRLPTPGTGEETSWVAEHLGDLCRDEPHASGAFRGGQTAADDALGALDISFYARRRNEVLPRSRRGATGLSPWIRHGLLDLPRVWDAVADTPPSDRRKFRDELCWQEYSRHLYARLGTRTRSALRAAPARATDGWDEPWPRDMACVDACVTELHDDGWLVNQTRMWMSSQWTVRAGHDWADGESEFFAHLLDGSRAANRVGWQWTIGAGTGKPYGFSRWQVRKRAPQLCRSCALSDDCPIERWPDIPSSRPAPERDPRLRSDPDPEATGGPSEPVGDDAPDAVWLTAESLGDADPALAAHPGLPAVFVFDEPLLRRLSLSGKRLVFLAETLADLATRREVRVYRRTPGEALAGAAVAVTHAPVPGFGRRRDAVEPAVIHPWPWLHRPHDGPVTSFSAWRKRLARR